MGTLDIKYKACHKNTDPNFNLEAKKPVSDTITPLLRANVKLLVRKSPVCSVYIQQKLAGIWNRMLLLHNLIQTVSGGYYKSAFGERLLCIVVSI
jgi:hypothetical protein